MAITSAQRQDIIDLYIAIAGRAPDAAGLSYWSQAFESGMSIDSIASSMWDTNEAKAIYPRSMTAEDMIEAFYVNTLGRASDAAGKAFWVDVLNTKGAVATFQQMISAVKNYNGTDAEGLKSKALFEAKEAISVTLAVTQKSNDLSLASTTFSNLTTAIMTNNTSKEDALAAATTQASSASGQTFTLTKDVIDNITGTAGNDTFIGADTTLNAADTIVGGEGTDTLNYTNFTVAAPLPAASISGVEVLNVRAVTSAVNSSDLSLYSGLTTFNSDRSNVDITVTNLANGGTFGIIGNGTVTNAAAANFGYAAAATAGVINISGGTLGASAVTLTGAGLLSTTINSTGAANVIGNFADAATSKALTINATTGLTTGTIGDSAARTALTINATGDVTTGAVTSSAAVTAAITGAGKVTTNLAAVVAPTITVAGSGVVSIGTLNAATTTVTSTQTAGGLTATMNATVTTKLTGGAGDDVITTGAVLTTGSINAGGGTADRLIVADSTHIDATTGAKHSGFERLQVQDGVSVDASQLAANNTLTSAVINQSATAATGITNMNATTAGAVKVIAAGGTGVITFGIKDATVAGNIDTLKLALDDGATTVGNFILTAPAMSGIENLEIAASENFTISALTAATALSSVKVTGAGNSNVTTGAVDFAANSTFDFSAATGTVIFDASAAQAGATATGLSIKGSSTKANTLSGSAKADVITGGTGADTITGKAGNDTINLTETTAAVDTVIFSASTTNGLDTITGFQGGATATSDKLDVRDMAGVVVAGTAITAAGAVIATADRKDFLQVINTDGTAASITTGGTKTLAAADFTAGTLTNVAAFIAEKFTGNSTATDGDTGIYAINYTAAGSTTTYIYQWDNNATADVTQAVELVLVGAVTRDVVLVNGDFVVG